MPIVKTRLNKNPMEKKILTGAKLGSFPKKSTRNEGMKINKGNQIMEFMLASQGEKLTASVILSHFSAAEKNTVIRNASQSITAKRFLQKGS